MVSRRFCCDDPIFRVMVMSCFRTAVLFLAITFASGKEAIQFKLLPPLILVVCSRYDFYHHRFGFYTAIHPTEFADGAEGAVFVDVYELAAAKFGSGICIDTLEGLHRTMMEMAAEHDNARIV